MRINLKIDDPILKADVPTYKIKGDIKITIEIDDVKKPLLNNDEYKRIKITCFDFQLDDTLKRYKKRNPKIIKKW